MTDELSEIPVQVVLGIKSPYGPWGINLEAFLYSNGQVFVGIAFSAIEWSQRAGDKPHYVIGMTLACALERCRDIGIGKEFAVSISNPQFFQWRDNFTYEWAGDIRRFSEMEAIFQTKNANKIKWTQR